MDGQRIATLARAATVLSSGAPVEERVTELLAELRRTIPFEAALLCCVDPVGGQARPLVSEGYAGRIADRLMSDAFRSEFIDRFDMVRTRRPLREKDLPVDPLTIPSIAEYLTPSGLIEGMVTPLVDASGRYAGCFFISTTDKRHPDDSARDTVALLAPALTNLVDPHQSLRRLASMLDPSWSRIGVSPDGATVALGESAAPNDLDPALVSATATCVRAGRSTPLAFLWPKSPGRDWLQVRIHPCRRETGDRGHWCGAVLATRDLVSHSRLTRREIEVLTSLAAGETNPMIAARLCVTPRTIKTHVEHILGKLGVSSRCAAAARAVEEGLVLPPVGMRPGI